MSLPFASRSIAASVLVVNWNGKPLLEACLEALARQSYVDFETILIDNGSTDGSVEHVRERFPEVKILGLPQNVGFARANNLGLAQARGRYVVVLNNDAEPEADWLSELIGALEARSEVGFAASRLLLWDRPDRVDACGDFYTVDGVPGKIGHLQSAALYSEAREVFGACAGAAIYRRSMLDEIGFFDEDFFITHEDSDLSFRAQLMGYRCLYIPSAIVRHRLGATVGRASDIVSYYAQRNSEFVYLKNMPGRLVLMYWPLHVLAVLASLAGHVRRRRARAFFRGKWDALKMISPMLDKRRKIQAERRAPDAQIKSLLSRDWAWSRLKAKAVGKARWSKGQGVESDRGHPRA